jgi:hypothetical protein
MTTCRHVRLKVVRYFPFALTRALIMISFTTKWLLVLLLYALFAQRELGLPPHHLEEHPVCIMGTDSANLSVAGRLIKSIIASGP